MSKQIEKIAIYGMGEAGRQLFASLNLDAGYQVTALFDDNPDLHGLQVQGITIQNPSLLGQGSSPQNFSTVLLALPSASHQRRRAILDRLRPLKVGVKVLPTVQELLDCRVSASSLMSYDAGDLLGRDEIPLDQNLLSKNISGKNVLVTGAGGSIGSELCREISKANPAKLVLLDHSEYALYEVHQQLQKQVSFIIEPVLGSIGSLTGMQRLLAKYSIQTVYHTAAYKHVPLVEENPIAGLSNNIFGTFSLLKACRTHQVETFVLISTDKAVRPTNIMGASKRIAEQLVQAFASESKNSIYSMVRFGNVLDSNGSVVPLFRKQIKGNRRLTVTHKDVTRYFMSLGEAVRLVIQAGAMAKGGEVFVLDMGEPVKIYDLAVQMIELSGLVVDRDVSVEITGLRPGEKLHEELLIGNDPQATAHPRIWQAKEQAYSEEKMQAYLAQLEKLLHEPAEPCKASLNRLLAEQVEGYMPSDSLI